VNGIVEDMQTMAMLHFAIFVCVVATAGLYSFYLVWRNFHRARIIEDTPTARVRSAPQGYVELQGAARVLPEQPILSALTHTPCVWYRFRIEQERGRSRSGPNWSEVESGSSEIPFVFFDATGECLVDPRRAEVTPGHKRTWYGSSRWPGGEEKRGFFGELVGGRYRYTEERIDGQEVYLLGWFDTLRSTDQPVDAELSRRLQVWKQDYPALLQRFDSNRDGQIDENEWQTARQQAQRAVIEDRAARSAEPAINIIRSAGQQAYPFLISARPQFLLSDRYRRHAQYALVGCMVAAALLAWMLSARLQG
jgi:hypothetical protein